MTTLNVGALPPYKVTYIDPGVCATSQPQWFVMGTVDGNPRNGQGPVAICEYEPSAHAIAALLNASVAPGQYLVELPNLSRFARLWSRFVRRPATNGDAS